MGGSFQLRSAASQYGRVGSPPGEPLAPRTGGAAPNPKMTNASVKRNGSRLARIVRARRLDVRRAASDTCGIYFMPPMPFITPPAVESAPMLGIAFMLALPFMNRKCSMSAAVA